MSPSVSWVCRAKGDVAGARTGDHRTVDAAPPRCHHRAVDQVSGFYGARGGLVAVIRARLEAAGLDPATLRPSDLAPVDEFHIRGRAASLEIVEALELTSGSHLLDLGSGLGGPARTVAELTGCTVTGVDLTPEFCVVANELSRWTGLADRTRFQVGDATATGLGDRAVDAAMTVHVAMNIPDKASLYAEAFRVLRPGGRFVVYDVLQGEGGDVRYPVPWAQDSSTSFLATPDEVRTLLRRAGFEVISEVDSSDESLTWFEQVRARVQRDGPPPVSFAAFLGDEFGRMAANQVANLAERRIRTVMYSAVRPLRGA